MHSAAAPTGADQNHLQLLVLSGALSHEDTAIRCRAVIRLRAMQTPRAWAILREALGNSSAAVRLSALLAFDDAPHELAASDLRALLQHERDEAVLIEAVQRANRYKPHDVGRALVQLTVVHLTGRTMRAVLRALVEQLFALQPLAFMRVVSGFRDTYDWERRALGDEFYGRAPIG